MIGGKSKKFIKVDAPAAVKDMAALIEFMNNQEEYKAYLDEIQSFTDKANESLLLLCKAEEADALLAQARDKQKIADKMLSEAKESTEIAISNANDQAKSILISSEVKSREMMDAAEKATKEAIQEKASAEGLKGEADKMLRQAKSISEAFAKREEAIRKAESEIARKKELLAKL